MKSFAAILFIFLLMSLSSCAFPERSMISTKDVRISTKEARNSGGQISTEDVRGSVGKVPKPIKSWQRGILAEGGMQLVPDVMDAYIDEHIYFSKEGSRGGSSIGGGGCGCN